MFNALQNRLGMYDGSSCEKWLLHRGPITHTLHKTNQNSHLVWVKGLKRVGQEMEKSIISDLYNCQFRFVFHYSY